MSEFLAGFSEHIPSFEMFMDTATASSLASGVEGGFSLGLEGLTFEPLPEGVEGVTEKSFQIGNDRVTWDEVKERATRENISTLEFMEKNMSEAQFKEFENNFKESVKNNVFVTDKVTEAAKAASTTPEIRQTVTTTYGDAVNQPPAEANTELAKQQAVFMDAIKDLSEKVEKRLKETKEKAGSNKGELLKYSFEFAKFAAFAGLTLAEMRAIANARNGCWTFNTETRSYIEKVDSSKDKNNCNCKGIALVPEHPNPCDPYYTAEHPHMCTCVDACNTLKGNDTKHDWTDCGQICNCVDENGKPLKAQIEFKVVNESIFETFANIVAGVGLKIIDAGEGVLDVVEAGVKSLAQIFSQWWVILLIVGIPVIIIIIATVVTQVPKRSQVKGGRFRYLDLNSSSLYGGQFSHLSGPILY